ncbi:Uma2 family endonuclease [Anabaena cylindrica UHCC 0172]|nr:Uma2 family endonuclease [Anabaena cylindrica]MEA5552170.1 Uma2 family endonuclease [Anabaena cylindrica UHCC 0172]
MQLFLDYGVKLGWLINRKMRQVEIYRLDKPVEILEFPQELSGEDSFTRIYFKYGNCLGININIIYQN